LLGSIQTVEIIVHTHVSKDDGSGAILLAAFGSLETRGGGRLH